MAFRCIVCTRQYLSEVALRKHVKESHVAPLAYACPVCSKRFMQRCSLLIHRKLHLQNKILCIKCPKTFTTPEDLEQHDYLCHYATPLKCEACQNEFFTLRKLQKHTCMAAVLGSTTECVQQRVERLVRASMAPKTNDTPLVAVPPTENQVALTLCALQSGTIA